MPTLIRLIIGLLFIGGLVYAAMFALATLVEPEQREVTVRIQTRDLLNESGGEQPGSAVQGLPTPNVGEDDAE